MSYPFKCSLLLIAPDENESGSQSTHLVDTVIRILSGHHLAGWAESNAVSFLSPMGYPAVKMRENQVLENMDDRIWIPHISSSILTICLSVFRSYLLLESWKWGGQTGGLLLYCWWHSQTERNGSRAADLPEPSSPHYCLLSQTRCCLASPPWHAPV